MKSSFTGLGFLVVALTLACSPGPYVLGAIESESSTGATSEDSSGGHEDLGTQGETGDPLPVCTVYFNGDCGDCVAAFCGEDGQACENGSGGGCCYANCVYENYWGTGDITTCHIECGSEHPMSCDTFAACVQESCASQCPFE